METNLCWEAKAMSANGLQLNVRCGVKGTKHLFENQTKLEGVNMRWVVNRYDV